MDKTNLNRYTFMVNTNYYRMVLKDKLVKVT